MVCTIKQIKDVANCDYAFRDYDATKFNEDDYEDVFSFLIPQEKITRAIYEPECLLSDIYVAFNRCSDYKCLEYMNAKKFTDRSLSVSDIVELGDKKFYCQSLGWKVI